MTRDNDKHARILIARCLLSAAKSLLSDRRDMGWPHFDRTTRNDLGKYLDNPKRRDVDTLDGVPLKNPVEFWYGKRQDGNGWRYVMFTRKAIHPFTYGNCGGESECIKALEEKMETLANQARRRKEAEDAFPDNPFKAGDILIDYNGVFSKDFYKVVGTTGRFVDIVPLETEYKDGKPLPGEPKGNRLRRIVQRNLDGSGKKHPYVILKHNGDRSFSDSMA